MFSSRVLLVSLFAFLVLVLVWTCPAHGQKSLQFAHGGDYALIPHDLALTPDQISIEVWIRVHALGDTSQAGAAGEQSVLDKRGGAGYQFRLAGDTFPLGAGVVAEPNLIFHTGLVNAYRWHHMALTQDADSMSFYFDGNLQERIANTYLPATTSDLYLGELSGCTTGCLWLRGEIDELRIWDHARAQMEIQDNMHVALVGDEPGLAALWNFDEDTGSVISDRTPNGNDGALFGNATLVASDAPVGFVPMPAPTGFRTHGEEDAVVVRWRAETPQTAGAYNLYRADTLLVPVTADHLLATVTAPDSVYLDGTAEFDRTYYYVIAAVDGSGHLGVPSPVTGGRRNHIPKDYLVGTYYYPNRRGPSWWPGFYMRDYLVPQQPPLLGHYDGRDPEVIGRHLDWMLEYGVDFFLSDWWGQTAYEDSVLKESILPVLSGRPTRFSVYYETALFPDLGNIDQAQEDTLVSDFLYIADTYFDHPNFLRFEDRPVVFIHRSRYFGGAYEQAFNRIRSELMMLGHDVYLVGDEISRILTPDVEHMQFLDAITMFRSLSRPLRDGYCLDANSYAGNARFMSVWQSAALDEGKRFLPSVSPGSNGRPGNSSYWIIPRESGRGAGPTSQLEEHIRVLRSYVDPQFPAIMVSSWNHWESDTQVEPSVVTAATSEDMSGGGQYSGGYSYTGYGTLCLELLQSLLGYDPGTVILVSPEDDAMGQPRRSTLTWSELEGATWYHLQVSSSPDFSDPELDQDLLVPAWAVTDTLAANTTYTWRVRGQSSGGSGAWSVPFTFTTGTLVPVRLDYLRAEREEDGGVTVSWKVLDAESHAGFHVCRSAEGEREDPEKRVQISDRILNGREEYVFTDPSAPPAALDYWLQEIDRTGETRWYGPAPVVSIASPRAWPLRLFSNRPNPVRSGTTFAFTVPAAGRVRLQILDLRGRVVARPFDRVCDPGPHEVSWDGRDSAARTLPGGIYFYRLVTDRGTRSGKLVLMR